ncbi:glycosyltransferase family 2 protein [Hephaestia mangrovi]|uniref:glycosyltransferase family 2 protein n=1 Tax=Hephaestia mangrovi TaxID=2873268 RepID=UPI001CA64C51|nr:glycosyltransferase family 2 protein [Hephaestia mangrovi]MBY8829742.1 glycosyltransferase [Hephaestia mangrovi]
MAAEAICVIIPAFNAEATIARAIRSALAQQPVGEVIVVDDASTDDTVAAARRGDDGSGRLLLVELATNAGPSAARNAALARSQAPFVAVLDADDYLLPNRFEPLLAIPDWDLIADNILFVREGRAESSPSPPDGDRRRPLHFAEFIERNISKRGRNRAELGFLKPLMRRSLLDDLGLRYDDTVRLGEDYLLYAAAMAKGARFVLAERCGYVAIERAGSLSGRHRTADLAALMTSSLALADDPAIPLADRRLLRRHALSIRAKLDHRRFLDDKRQTGLARATLSRLKHPYRLAGVALDVLRDKRELSRAAAQAADCRALFDRGEFD